MESFSNLICFRMGLATRKLQKYYKNRLSEYSITLAQSFILLSLLELDGQNVKALAEALGIESSAITGLVDRMEREALVERRVNPGDRRAFQIHLKQKGRDLAGVLLPLAAEFNQDLEDSLSPEEQLALFKFFNLIEEIE